MGICVGRFSRTENRSAQTDNPYYDLSNRDLINARYHNFRPVSVHSRGYNQRPKLDNVQLKNSIINDWKHPNRYDYTFMKSENLQPDNCGPLLSDVTKPRYEMSKTNGDSTPTPSGVWPINGSGDCNIMSLKKKKSVMSQSRMQLNRDFDKSNMNLNINFSDEEDNITQRNTLFTDINNGFDKFQSQIPNSSIPDYRSKKSNGRKQSCSQRNCKSRDMSRTKSLKKSSNQKLKVCNNNSNNYHSPVEENINNSVGVSQKFHSSRLLDQDCYPIQYTFYVDDNDICTKPFYDRRMVAIAKTCRCRIYFHAKADETEKPLYYKGKPVRPVTITSPDMACLKRCLGSIDSQFPYFNCKAFLSLSS